MVKSESRVWQQLPGGATDIGVGPAGHVWVAGGSGVPYYWEIFGSPNSEPWHIASPNTFQGVTRIAVGPNGLPWAIVNNSQIVRRTGGPFPGSAWDTTIPGAATDIGVGPAGHVWVVGGSGVPHYWESFASPNPVQGDWPVPSNSDNLNPLTRIAVGPTGLPWAVSEYKYILRRTGDQFPGTNWEEFSQADALDIGVGPEGTVWIVATDGTPKGWDWDSSTWVPQPGVSLASISVGPQGEAWGVTSDGDIYRWSRPID